MLVASIYTQSWTFSCPTNILTNMKFSPSSFRLLFLHSLHIVTLLNTGLTNFPYDSFILVFHTLTFIRLRRTQRSNLRAYLSDKLFLCSGYNYFVGTLGGNSDSFRYHKLNRI